MPSKKNSNLRKRNVKSNNTNGNVTDQHSVKSQDSSTSTSSPLSAPSSTKEKFSRPSSVASSGSSSRSSHKATTAKNASSFKSGRPSSAATSNTKRSLLMLSFLPRLNMLRVIIGSILLIIASYYIYLGYQETRVNSPYNSIKMVQSTGLKEPDRYWGTYRSLNYFGMKTRDPKSPVMGLMWYAPSNLGHGGQGIRHWCDLGDNLNTYGWKYHDGRTFGVQEIQDGPFELKTSFVKYPNNNKYGGDWTVRISVRNTTDAWDRTLALVWYIALEPKMPGKMWYVEGKGNRDEGIHGETPGLGPFHVRFHPIKGRIVDTSYLSTVAPPLSKLKESLFSHFRVFTDKRGKRLIGLPGQMISVNGGRALDPTFIAVQITTESDFSLDISYQSTSGYTAEEPIPLLPPVIGREFTTSLQEKIAEYDRRFEGIFKLASKGFDAAQIKFAKHALSNMIGGIGYFYGASRVQSVLSEKPVNYWKAPLYTAVPSRSFFPRGFLWDEGFHGLLIASWDLDIELDIMCHWFDLMNAEGWIPREQILGDEALAKVPEEFVTQLNTNANPPTFFLTLRKILTHHKDELFDEKRFETLQRLYPRLQAWFAWYNTTQRGDILGAYRWRGRDAESVRELNPKTLTSGLDDYPRASHPTTNERHVDLRCWIAFAAGVMGDLATLLDRDGSMYYETAAYLSDNQLLNEQHLSRFTETYADWGLHTDGVELRRPQVTPIKDRRKPHHQQQQQQPPEMVRVTVKPPVYKYVDSTFGYVNLFPFILEILDHDTPYFLKTLNDMRDPKQLWTNYGLRSLSKQSPLYMKHNTEHDPPYWRGPVWLNINYLVLRALRHYGKLEGPHTALARSVYSELRDNIISNVIKEYQRSGYIWEQYDDTTGRGKGCNPFTGWSSLVVLVMAEIY